MITSICFLEERLSLACAPRRARMCASACNAHKRKLDMFRVVVPRVRMRIMHGRIMRVGASVRAVSVKTRAD